MVDKTPLARRALDLLKTLWLMPAIKSVVLTRVAQTGLAGSTIAVIVAVVDALAQS